MRPVPIVAAVFLAQAVTACSGTQIVGPSGPTGSAAPQPTIVNISPNTGSIYGGSVVTITGEIDRNASATIGGVQVRLGYSPANGTAHSFVAPPHAVGTVDVVVRNAGGASQTLVGGYTYVDPDPLGLEGEWAGYTVDGTDTWIEFAVSNHRLTSVRCVDPFGHRVEIDLSLPAENPNTAIVNGRVEFAGNAGRFSAWAAAPAETAGTMDMMPCVGPLHWDARPRSSGQ